MVKLGCPQYKLNKLLQVDEARKWLLDERRLDSYNKVAEQLGNPTRKRGERCWTAADFLRRIEELKRKNPPTAEELAIHKKNQEAERRQAEAYRAKKWLEELQNDDIWAWRAQGWEWY